MRAMISFIVLALGAFALGVGATETNSVSTVSSTRSRLSFEVFGGVQHDGVFGWTNGMTILDGIKAAGGFNHFAGWRIVIHHIDGSSDSFSRKLLETTNQAPRLRLRDEVVVFGNRRVY